MTRLSTRRFFSGSSPTALAWISPTKDSPIASCAVCPRRWIPAATVSTACGRQLAAVCVAVFFFVNGFQLLKLRVCGAVGGFLGDVAHAIQDRVGSLSLSLPTSVSFSPSAEWTTLFHTSLMIAIALVVLGSLVLYDLDESV